MKISEILSVENILCARTASSKKSALEDMADLLSKANPQLDYENIFECLISRERLGSTGLGHGVAIPHGRLANNSSTIAAFVQIDGGVDYDAPDGSPVDLLFGLLVPEESTDEHLQILSKLAEMFSHDDFLIKLRQAKTREAIHQLLTL